MRVAADVDPLELAEYQKAARLVLRHPLITALYPDASTLPLVRKWVRQLRADLGEVLGYTLLASGDTIRLRRVQDALDGTRPAVTRARRPFDRRRYAYLVLTLSALGRSGTQVALSELADAVAADAGRIDGLGMDTGRKPDRDAFVDAVSWLEARGALQTADGSAIEWVNDPERAEALYDIDREVVGAIYAPSRVLQHLNSVTELLDGPGGSAPTQGREERRRVNARQARRLVVEQPVVYYPDVDEGLRGQLRSASLAEDVERLTGLGLERRAEGVALVNAGQRFTDVPFPSTGTVAQAALLLCARIAGYLQHHSSKIERLPAATAAERLAPGTAPEPIPEAPAPNPDPMNAASPTTSPTRFSATCGCAPSCESWSRNSAPEWRRSRPPTRAACWPRRSRCSPRWAWWRGWTEACWCCRCWPATAASPRTSRTRPAHPEPRRRPFPPTHRAQTPKEGSA